MQHELRRRDFLGTLLVLPAGIFLVRCSSSSSNNTPPAPAANPTVSGSQAIFTSSTAQEHFHTFGVPLTDFLNPPSGGLSGDTSVNASHSHHVTIAMSEFASMQAGSSVAITTSNVSGHTHVFTFIKLSAAAQDGGLHTKDGGLVTP
jgi:hypothetical protein